MTRVVRDFCALALIFVLTTATAWAQLATAELNGRVTDSSGAVLPGVTVTATQTATGLVRTRRDRRGRRLPALESADRPVPPGGLAAGIPQLRADRARAARSARRRRSTPRSSSARSRRRSRWKPPRRSSTSAAPASARSSRTSASSSCRSRAVRSTDLLVLSAARRCRRPSAARGMPGGVKISVAGGLSNRRRLHASTGRRTTTRRRTSTSRCRSRTRCRSSASRPAA